MTKEDAKKDIEKVSAQFGSFGPDTEADRAAQLFLQSFDVLSRRLNNPAVIKMLYLSSEAEQVLPDGMRSIAKRLCDGDITPDQASGELTELKAQYESLIAEMSITPAIPSALFNRS